MNRKGKVVEERGTIWVDRRTEGERLAVVSNDLFNILHPS
jgi:hypothetical protein